MPNIMKKLLDRENRLKINGRENLFEEETKKFKEIIKKEKLLII